MEQQKTLWSNFTALTTANTRGSSTQLGKEKHGSRSSRTQDHQSHQFQYNTQRSKRGPTRWQRAMGNKQPSSAQPPQSATGIPRPKEVPATDDYWIGEGHLCKSPHKARTELYLSPQTQHGPDVTKLNPERPTMVRPTREQDGTR